MNSRTFAIILMLALAILVGANGATYAQGSINLNISLPSSLNGTNIAPGEYRVRWDSHSPEITVTFNKGRKVIATADGKLVDRDTKYDHDGVVYRVNADGTHSIQEIRLAGKKQAIVFGS